MESANGQAAEPGGRGSIAIQFVDDAVSVARRRGLAIAPMLAAAGIAPARLAQPRARVTVASFGRLWRALADAMDDEFFGLDAHPMRRGSFRMMCHATIGAATLEQALRRQIRFLGLVLDDQRACLTRDGDIAVVVVEARRGAVPLFAYGTVMTLLLGLSCWLVDRRVPIASLDFAAPEPRHAAEYRVLFGERTRFDAACTRLAFDAAALALPVQRRAEDLDEFLTEAPANFLVRYRNPHSFAARVRRRLRELPPEDWPDFDALAKSMRTTASTLRRRLDEEGQPYQAIKDALRRDLAIELLADAGNSVLDVACRLGFAEASAFHRAFRRWTGASPGAYRDRTNLRAG
ncbi:MAG: AraC family transcriptional regulator [Rhodocyclaceae bacterium]|nr:AraC family transcriptional regulator [Rhodocyclaceae bacterium]